MTWPQFAPPYVVIGVTRMIKVKGVANELTPWDKLIGMRTPHPMILRTRNIFRHILVNRRKTVATSPTWSIRSCSFVRTTGPNHANMPLPTGGGACLSSECLSFGAYTTELYGRRREKAMAMTIVKPIEEPRPARSEFCCNYESSVPTHIFWHLDEHTWPLNGFLRRVKRFSIASLLDCCRPLRGEDPISKFIATSGFDRPEAGAIHGCS